MAKNRVKNRIVILISGNGTNLQSIIDARKMGKINAEIVGVISNRTNVFGLERAKLAGIPALTLIIPNLIIAMSLTLLSRILWQSLTQL